MSLVNCTECNNEVSDKASACPKCGAPVKHSEIEEQRAAVTQSHLNQDLSGPFFLQIVIVAIIAGFHEGSWLIFGGAFIGLTIVLLTPKIGKIVGLALAAYFGYVGFMFGYASYGIEAGVVVGAFFSMLSLAASYGGMDYMKDLSKE